MRRPWWLSLLAIAAAIAVLGAAASNNTGNGSSSGTLTSCGGNLTCPNGVVTDSQNPSYTTITVSGGGTLNGTYGGTPTLSGGVTLQSTLGIGGQATFSQACTASGCATPPQINAAANTYELESLATSANDYAFAFVHNGASATSSGIAAFFNLNTQRAKLDNNGDLTLSQGKSGFLPMITGASTGTNEIDSNTNGANDAFAIVATGTASGQLADFCKNAPGACGTPEFEIGTAGVITFFGRAIQSATGKLAGHCTITSATSCTFTGPSFSSTPVMTCFDEASTNALPCAPTISGTTITVTLLPYVQSGSCALTTGACASQSFTVSYNATPNCSVMDVNATHTSISAAGATAVSSSAITPATAASGSETVYWKCQGVPNTSTGHTFGVTYWGDPN